MRARDLAHGKWRSVLTQLGIPAGVLDKKHHPCPATGEGEDRFRFTDRNGSGSFFCGCSAGNGGGLALVMCCKQLTYPQAAKEVERVVGQASATVEPIKPDPRVALNRIRAQLKPAGESVSSYLASRGLSPVPTVKQARLPYWDKRRSLGEFDCMVALICGPDGKGQSYHVTYLTGATKADVPSPRKVMTPVTTITGGAIRLFPVAEQMGVAEGIETALSAHLLTGIPTWAAVSAHGIETFMPPKGCKRLVVFGDGDTSFTGQAAAYALARKQSRLGLSCEVRMPTAGDWNDELRRVA